MFIFVSLCITFCPFWFCDYNEEEENDVPLLVLSYRCIVTMNVLWLFLMVSWLVSCM